MSNPPLVLFARVHNSGRSVAAPALTEHYSGGGVQARSAGSVTNGSRSAALAVPAHLRRCAGSVAAVTTSASRTCSAVRPSGRCTSRVYRAERLTRVPIADRPRRR